MTDYEKLGEVAEKIRQVAKKRKVAVVTGNQGEDTKRIPTGIEELDDLMKEGIPLSIFVAKAD